MPNGNTAGGVIADLESLAAAGAPGDRLPSVRELMARHRVGPGTVQRAVGALAARGIVEARPGHGTFVARRAPEAPAPDLGWQSVALGHAGGYADASALEDLRRPPSPGDLVLSTGYLPPDLQPLGALAQAVTRAARRPDAWDRVPLEGIGALRAHFAAEVGGGAEAGDVLVCAGGQAALNACLRALAPPGAPVVVESPTYAGMLVLARAAGLRVVPVPSDADGVRPDLLADALARSGARVAYLQPTFANPHGTTLAAERRAAVIEVAASAGAFVIEDEVFRDLVPDPRTPPPPPLWHDDRDGHVVTVCDCASCRFAGGDRLLRALSEELGIGPGETTADGSLTLETSSDVGAGALSPAIRVDTLVYGPLTIEQAIHVVDQRRATAERPAAGEAVTAPAS